MDLFAGTSCYVAHSTLKEGEGAEPTKEGAREVDEPLVWLIVNVSRPELNHRVCVFEIEACVVAAS